MRPESRKTQLLAQDVGDELVIYDEQSHAAHRLSPTAAVVWRAADGECSLSELSSKLRESLDASASAKLSDEDGDALVRLALDELDRVGLLVRGLPGIGEAMTRREMIGVSAALLPAIASIVAPTPAMAQTPAQFIVTLQGSYRHVVVGESSEVCAEVSTTPPQPGATYVVNIGGVERTGTLDALGRVMVRRTITARGQYSVSATVSTTGLGGRTAGASTIVNVTEAQGTCPAPTTPGGEL